MAEELTRDERDARLVLDSVLTPHLQRVVEGHRAKGFTDREIARWLGDTRQRGLGSGYSAAELDAQMFKPDLSATTRRFMAGVAEGLTAAPDSLSAPSRPPQLESRSAAPGGPAGAMPGVGREAASAGGEGPGWGTTLAAVGGLAGIAALTKGRGLARAFRALPPETQARITQMAAGAIGAGGLGTMWWLRDKERLPDLSDPDQGPERW